MYISKFTDPRTQKSTTISVKVIILHHVEEYQFWQHEYHLIALANQEHTMQRLNYLHENPVLAGIVWQPEHYKYSGAMDYYGTLPGLLPLVLLG